MQRKRSITDSIMRIIDLQDSPKLVPVFKNHSQSTKPFVPSQLDYQQYVFFQGVHCIQNLS